MDFSSLFACREAFFSRAGVGDEWQPRSSLTRHKLYPAPGLIIWHDIFFFFFFVVSSVANTQKSGTVNSRHQRMAMILQSNSYLCSTEAPQAASSPEKECYHASEFFNMATALSWIG